MTQDELVKHMVDRFLAWRLPENFAPDCGIHFDADAAKKLNPRNARFEPVGTNLFDATQAEAMIRHLLEESGLDKLFAEVEQASEWRMDIRKQVTQADAVAKSWKEKSDAQTVENDSLREQLFDALMDGERMRGYLDGTVDAEAPAMVPAQRERRLDHYTGTPRQDFGNGAGYASGGYGRERPKRWFHK